MKFKLGIDVGGTFTDFMLISDDGNSTIYKTLSTPKDPAIGVLNGIRELSEIVNAESFDQFINQITTIVHGTTVSTNALLTLRGAKTALLTTKGLRDALEMRRGIREEQYNNHYRNVTPLVPRYLRVSVDERINAQGKVLTLLKEKDLDTIISFLKKEKIEAIAICFMNAFSNNTHEKKAFKYLKSNLPECFITSSTEVLPSIRFYERVSTTVVNAYIGPVVANYLDNLTDKLDEVKFKGSLLIMQSNGGVVSPDIVKKSPAVTVLSGPAAAPTASIYYANLLGYKNAITVDMGGTSFDASIVVNNQCITSTNGSINRYQVALPALDIITIGAGGGSIGWLDNGNMLQMGPQSAGALPGPICYDQGGAQPTCTDANLVLGYLNPNYFAGGKISLNYKKTKEIITNGIAKKLGLNLMETASGMFRIINSNMAQGVRQVSIEKGYDPREFLFIVAGGAGAIHAGEICKELEISMFVVPNVSSIFCAAGMLLGDLQHDYVQSYIAPFSAINKKRFLKLYNNMLKTGAQTLQNEGITPQNIDYFPVLDLRYIGQYHEVQLSVPWHMIISFNLEHIKKLFHKEHNRLFGYSLEEEGTEIEMINLRLKVLGKTEKPAYKGANIGSASLKKAFKENRSVYIPEKNKYQDVPVYNGELSLSELTIKGPAIIEKITTSIFVGQSYNCYVDEYNSFIVYDKQKFPKGYKGQTTKKKVKVKPKTAPLS